MTEGVATALDTLIRSRAGTSWEAGGYNYFLISWKAHNDVMGDQAHPPIRGVVGHAEPDRRLMDAMVSLYRLREQRGLTQVDLAKQLDVTQGNVSRVENASDLYVSTLARYVTALGGRLELNAVFPDQVVSVALPSDRESA